MKTKINLYLILLTLAVVAMAWITGQLDQQPMQIMIVILALLSGISILAARLLSKRETKEKSPRQSDLSFGHRERKSGLTWGGGNIKASEAKRGTRRKFLGK